MTERESELVLGTLRAALAQGAILSSGSKVHQALYAASTELEKLSVSVDLPSIVPGLKLGSAICSIFRVESDDTAAAMGHPDPLMNVLGSPRLALWFEIAASRLLPEPTSNLSHVGVGILVHHLAKAELGNDVVVDVRVEEVEGKRAVFSLRASVQDRLIALGVHERVVMVRSAR